MKIPKISPVPLRYAFYLTGCACLVTVLSDFLLGEALDSSNCSLCALTFICLWMVIRAGWLHCRRKKLTYKKDLWSVLQSRLNSSCRLPKILLAFTHVYTQPIILLMLVVSAAGLVTGSVLSIALAFVLTGNYTAGERMYQLSPRPLWSSFGDTSLTAYLDDLPSVQWNKVLGKSDRKSSAIATVYGPRSAKMAQYYGLLAENFLERSLSPSSLNSIDHGKNDCEAALAYSRKRLEICLSEERWLECASALGLIGVCQIRQRDMAGARLSAERLVSYIEKAPPGRFHDRLMLGDLHYIAAQVDAPELYKRGSDKMFAQRRVNAIGRRHGFFDATSVAILALIFVLICLLQSFERSILAFSANRAWRKDLLATGIRSERLLLLDNLTTLSLYRGKVDEADQYSKLMLKVACEEC